MAKKDELQNLEAELAEARNKLEKLQKDFEEFQSAAASRYISKTSFSIGTGLAAVATLLTLFAGVSLYIKTLGFKTIESELTTVHKNVMDLVDELNDEKLITGPVRLDGDVEITGNLVIKPTKADTIIANLNREYDSYANSTLISGPFIHTVSGVRERQNAKFHSGVSILHSYGPISNDEGQSEYTLGTIKGQVYGLENSPSFELRSNPYEGVLMIDGVPRVGTKNREASN